MIKLHMRGALLAATSFASLIAGQASAQSADRETSVAEVVVTAQKREQKLQDVPISMEVLSAKKVEAFHANDFRTVASSIPNLSVQAIGGNDTIYIRGFGSPPQNYSFDQSVSLYVDGIYAGRARQFMAPFFDLERMEVLRGPQGALFGKNTAAGAISIISAAPTSSFEGQVTGVYNFDLKGYEASGYVSGPVSDGLSVRLAAKIVDQDGYIENLAKNNDMETGIKEELARLTVKYQPSDRFDFLGKVEYSHRRDIGNASASGPLTTAQQVRLTKYAVDGPFGAIGLTNEAWNLAGTANLQVGAFTLTSVSGFSSFDATKKNDFDQTNPAGGVVAASVFNSYPEKFQQWSQEIRLQSPTGKRLEYILGAYYDNSQYQVDQFNNYILPALGNFIAGSHFKQQAESASVFGQATFKITDQFRALGSLRYTTTKKRGHFQSKYVAGPFSFRPITTADGRIDEDNIDPSITLQYDIAPGTMVYATYGQGSKSGGFVSNTYGTTNATFAFQPEKSKNYEAGIKSVLMDGTLVLNASVYDTKFEDLQVSVYNPNTQGYVTGNAAKASGRGVEGSISWYPVRNFDIQASGAYLDSKYDDYPGASCLASQTLAQCNPLVPASVAANNIAGAPLSQASKYSGTFQAHHRLELPGDMKLDTTAVVSGRSKFFDSDDQSPLYGVQKAYAKLDLRVELSPMDSRWHVAIVGRNLTNEHTTSGAFRLPGSITAVSRAIYWIEQPRNISMEASLKF